MAGKPSLKGTTVLEYLERFPHSSKSAIARKLVADHPLLFKDAEAVRSLIREHTGAVGARSRKGKFVKHDTTFSRENPFGLPESDERKWQPYILPTTANNILILSDIHLPYHNIKALSSAIRYGKENGVNAVILNGDVMDCHELSSFVRDPKKRKFAGELDAARTFLASLKKALPKAKIFFKVGNHEERWQRFLRTHAPQICDMDEFRLDVILRLGELGIEWIDEKRIMKAGRLNILHGHEFGKGYSAPVNAARSFYLKAKESCIAGHLHQVSEHTEPNMSGNLTTAWSLGCLCELNPEYMPINKWAHGFAHVRVNKDGSFQVRNFRMIAGEIV